MAEKEELEHKALDPEATEADEAIAKALQVDEDARWGKELAKEGKSKKGKSFLEAGLGVGKGPGNYGPGFERRPGGGPGQGSDLGWRAEPGWKKARAQLGAEDPETVRLRREAWGSYTPGVPQAELGFEEGPKWVMPEIGEATPESVRRWAHARKMMPPVALEFLEGKEGKAAERGGFAWAGAKPAYGQGFKRDRQGELYYAWEARDRSGELKRSRTGEQQFLGFPAPMPEYWTGTEWCRTAWEMWDLETMTEREEAEKWSEALAWQIQNRYGMNRPGVWRWRGMRSGPRSCGSGRRRLSGRGRGGQDRTRARWRRRWRTGSWR